MGIKGFDKRKFAIKSLYYAVTLVCLGVLALALRQTFLYTNISMGWWVLLYIILAAYAVGATILTIRLKRGTHKVAFHSLALQLIPLCAAIVTFCNIDKEDNEYTPITGRTYTYERHFNDMQNKHKTAALKNGLSPFKSRAAIEEQYKKLRRGRKLVHIETCPKYVVRDLTHSSPYVVPKVKELLDDIADRFQEKPQSKARFVVTSVLRTEEDVKKLRRVNGNASTASCHCNATTIDISYVRFEADPVKPRGDYELRLALAQTLHELRSAGRCHVKIERKQYCYHITVR